MAIESHSVDQAPAITEQYMGKSPEIRISYHKWAYGRIIEIVWKFMLLQLWVSLPNEAIILHNWAGVAYPTIVT